MKITISRSWTLWFSVALCVFLLITAWPFQTWSQESAMPSDKPILQSTIPAEASALEQRNISIANAQNKDNPDVFSLLEIECVLSTTRGSDENFSCRSAEDQHRHIGDILRIKVKGLSSAYKNQIINSSTLINLYLDGRPVPGNYGTFIGNDSLEFFLVRSAESKDAWNRILGSPREEMRRLRVGAGIDGIEFNFAANNVSNQVISLEIFRARWAYVIGMVITSLSFTIMVVKTPILRDSSPDWEKTSIKDLPYSLGRTQMAIWFFIIMGSFIFIWLITQDYNNIITQESLALMGISGTTALSAVAIGSSQKNKLEEDRISLITTIETLALELQQKEGEVTVLDQAIAAGSHVDPTEAMMRRSQVRAEKASLERQIKEARKKKQEIEDRLKPRSSKGFLMDILNDFDGVSFHRLQILIWTIILGAIFIAEVWKNLTMPSFDANLLALQGISSFTYLGFKLPERMN